MTIKLAAPKNEIVYINNGGWGGAYINEDDAARINKFERKLPYGWRDKFKYWVEVLGGLAPDAGVYTVAVTDDLETAAAIYKEWQVAAPTMVAVIDSEDYGQVEPYGYG